MSKSIWPAQHCERPPGNLRLRRYHFYYWGWSLTIHFTGGRDRRNHGWMRIVAVFLDIIWWQVPTNETYWDFIFNQQWGILCPFSWWLLYDPICAPKNCLVVSSLKNLYEIAFSILSRDAMNQHHDSPFNHIKSYSIIFNHIIDDIIDHIIYNI